MSGRIRFATLALGVAVTAYGVLLLLDLGWGNARATLTWLVGGVVLHDGVLAPLMMLLAAVALRLVPRDRLAPYVVGLVVLAPVTLLAIPVLGRFGARADNPTLLDRHYWVGWSLMVALVLAAILVVRYVERRRRVARRGMAQAKGGARGPGDGGR